jgi:putative autoinducer-2 (AI-2) aldolase
MADKDNKSSKDYHLNVEPPSEGFFVKGAWGCDWGMKNRLARMFNPKSGNTVMLAFDHGYIMGPTSGLERLDVTVPPLIPHVDVLMSTRGAFRTCISACADKPVCLRVNYDASVLFDDMSNGGGMACDIRNAVRMNASCLAVQTFIGASGEKNSLELLARVVDAGTDYGIPTMGVVAVGKQMERTEQFFLLATRILAENGAQLVKSYYCDGFERVASACPVPIVIAGGKKLPEDEALDMAWRAINEGARGVDMGRNIFQAKNPAAMAQAVSKVVHEGFSAKEAHEYYVSLQELLNSEVINTKSKTKTGINSRSSKSQ